jgi:CheY-like chemotaxis protein
MSPSASSSVFQSVITAHKKNISFETSTSQTLDGFNSRQGRTNTQSSSINESTRTSVFGDAVVPGHYEFDTPIGSVPSTPIHCDRSMTLPTDPSLNAKNVLADLHARLLASRMKCLKTMVVDDTPSNLKMLQRLLTNNSVTSDSAVDGVNAIEKYNNRDIEYDLIFMDYTMPNMVRHFINNLQLLL